tara:strand:- start:1088 stop:1504 length:417 start_codon:yes stop_codon:yes gene_type:complete
MPKQIFSKVKENLLMLCINRFNEISEDRIDISPANELLQISTKKLKQDTNFKAHRHNFLERKTTETHEAWIILEGKIKATFWDLDDSILFETALQRGDCAVVYKAGHSFVVLEENTILYEVKNGPYLGQQKDKTFIKD